MTHDTRSASPRSGPRNRISLERIYQADIQDVWDQSTTGEGIESWWGPGGRVVAEHPRHQVVCDHFSPWAHPHVGAAAGATPAPKVSRPSAFASRTASSRRSGSWWI